MFNIADSRTGSNPVLTTKFRINYPEIMEGSKLPIDYGVRCTVERSRLARLKWETGLGFNSLLVSKLV